MIGKKLLFFDIDGTLVGFDGKVPDSTWDGLNKARKNGHRLFLCTGRSLHQINKRLLAFGFDGIVASVGGYVEYKGKILYQEVFGKERLENVLECFRESGSGLILELKDKCVSSRSSNRQFLKLFQESAKVTDLKELESFAKLDIDDNIISYPQNYSDTQSILYCNSPYRTEEVYSRLCADLHVDQASFKEPDPFSGEITLASVSKQTGMQRLLDHLKRDRGDVIAFGDSTNDITMLNFADTAVVMGNAEERIRRLADYVTDSVDADGIYKSLRHLRLF